MKYAWTGALALTTALLAGCGGGDGGVAPPQQPSASGDVPATALGSTQAYAAFVGAQASDDSRAPLALGELVAPASDTDAPIAVP
jgi:hypothetical protein